MTNATSYEEEWLYAWEPGKEAEWVHPQVDISIKEPLPVDRFYAIMSYVDASWGPGAASLVGLRSEESLNRYGAVTRTPAIEGVNWSSRANGDTVKLYPIYDWTFEDVWTYIGNEDIPYNRIYDFMYAKQMRLTEMRVSNLIHEKAFKSLATLQEFEPDTYDRIVRRLKGTRTAARYGKESIVFDVRKRPARFKTWKAYRDFLLSTYTGDQIERFLDRFARQQEDERVYRQQARQLLINDWEDNVPVKKVRPKENPLQKWMDIL
jgi:predicted phosphoadenosine phosphosulfate sulfurtransferase